MDADLKAEIFKPNPKCPECGEKDEVCRVDDVYYTCESCNEGFCYDDEYGYDGGVVSGFLVPQGRDDGHS